MQSTAGACLLIGSLCLVACGQADYLAPKFTINLDLPPYERYQQLGAVYADKWPTLLHQIGAQFRFMNVSTGKPGMRMAYILAAGMFQSIRQPYRDELLGFAVSANRTVGEVIVFNVFLDIFTHKHNLMCTSVVTEDTHGQILHGRNLDFLFQIMREMVVVLEFKRNSEIVYTGTSFAGFIGLMTGQKPYAFTVSYDSRELGSWQLNDWTAALTGTKGIISFLIRDVIEKANDFKQAVEMFSTSPLIAPCYLIVAGTEPREGVVITRGRKEAVDLWWLKPEQGRWYLVETNYDHWKPVPSDDDRRGVAEKALNQTGRADITPATLFKVLSTPVVFNNLTMHTTIMSAAKPWLYTTVARSRR